MKKTVKLAHKGLGKFPGTTLETGGQVSVTKIFYLIDFTWDSAGKWCLSNNDTQITLDSTEVIKTIA